MKHVLSQALALLLFSATPVMAACTNNSLAEREDYLSQSPGFGGRAASDFLTGYVPSSFGDSLAELQFYWQFRNTPQDDEALIAASRADTFAALQTYRHSMVKDRHIEPEFMLTLVRDLRSNRARQNDADWWLDGEEEAPELDIFRWLQGMAASDHWHRLMDQRHRYYRLPLLASWAAYDPWKWDRDGYRKVTDDALDRWEERRDPLWGVLAYARIHPEHDRTIELIEKFETLHKRVQSCKAHREEIMAYPAMRFHAVRLMATRSVRRVFLNQHEYSIRGTFDKPLWSRMLAILDEPVAPLEDRYLKERIAAYIAAHLIVFPNQSETLKDVLERAPWLWKDYHWLTAKSLDDFIEGLNTHGGMMPMHFNTGSVNYNLKLHAWNFIDAFSSNALLYIAKRLTVTKTRSNLAGMVVVRGFALGDWALQKRALTILAQGEDSVATTAKAILDAPVAERERLALLAIIEDKDTFDIRWKRGQRNWFTGPFWCEIVVDDKAVQQIRNRVWNGHSINGDAPPGTRRTLPRWKQNEDQPDLFDFHELSRIAKLPPAPELFLRRATHIARKESTRWNHWRARLGLGDDKRIGELLHRLILFSKTRCDASNDPNAGRLAWRALHSNPAWEEWAQKTPYWFGRKR